MIMNVEEFSLLIAKSFMSLSLTQRLLKKTTVRAILS